MLMSNPLSQDHDSGSSLGPFKYDSIGSEHLPYSITVHERVLVACAGEYRPLFQRRTL
jgi:hypothetical protein